MIFWAFPKVLFFGFCHYKYCKLKIMNNVLPIIVYAATP